jgi:type I restriction enzyme S subunit
MLNPTAECDYFAGYLREDHMVNRGDLLFSWSATLATTIWDREPGAVNQHIFKVIPKEETTLKFFHHLIDFSLEGLAGMAHGSTMRHIKRKDLLPYEVVVPNELAEQSRIAEILDTVDEGIRATERLIEKLKAIKAGLLHDLLTRGMDENGQLYSPARTLRLGTRQLSEVCDLSGGYGFPEVMQGKQSGGLPFIKVSDMSLEGNERWIQSAANYVSTKTASSMGWKPFPKHSIVFAKVGAALRLNRRRILSMPTLIDNNMMAAIPKAGENPDFIYHSLCSVDLGTFVNEGALPSVNQAQVGSVKMPGFDVEEQGRIASILDNIDQRLDAEESALGKLRSLKKGLMHDLLTGKVRVLIDEEETA